MRRESVDPGVVALIDRARSLDAAARSADTVARPGRLRGGDRRRTPPWRPHRLAPSQEPVRMGVVDLRAGTFLAVAGGRLRLLRARGAGIARGAGDDSPPAEPWRATGPHPRLLPHAAVPHGTATVAPLALRNLDRRCVWCGAHRLELLLHQPGSSGGAGLRCGRSGGERALCLGFPLGALAGGALSAGGRSGAP